VTDLVKTLRTAPIALLALVLAVALVGTSCSSVDPVALQVGSWQLSSKDFEDQLDAYADAFLAAAGPANEAEASKRLHPITDGTWSTAFTSFILNEQLVGQLAVLAVQQAGVEISDDDRDQARVALHQSPTDGSIDVPFDDLAQSYQDVILEGLAARYAMLDATPSDDVLRLVYDTNAAQFDGQEFEAVKDGIVEVLKQNPNVLIEATLVVTARQTDIYVDGRFGQFDATTGQIVPPDGADQPAGADTSIEDLGSTAQ
jgi:hypothetical protein